MEREPSTELRIKTDPAQMDDVIRQITKVALLTPLSGETPVNERHFTIQSRPAPTELPPISVTFFAADDASPVTPAKVRSLFCNPVYAGLPPYSVAIADDELWLAAAAKLARRDSVEGFLVNLLYTLQTTLGVDGAERTQNDVPSSLPPDPPDDIGLERPIALRLQGEKIILQQLKKHLSLVFVLSENKGPGRATVKHFDARLSASKISLPMVSAKYIHPEKILSQRPAFTDEFIAMLTDTNVHWNLFANPMYTGVADFPRLVRDVVWLRGASALMREHGLEQFLVNMLYLMRRSSRDFAA